MEFKSPGDVVGTLILMEQVRGGAQDSEFPSSSEGVPMLLLCRPHLKQPSLRLLALKFSV